MKKLISFLGICVTAAVCVWAASAGYVTLDQMSVQDNTMVMTLSGAAKYHAFKISNPPRLVVEFSNTEHNVKNREQNINGAVIKRIRSGQFQNEPVKIARVVIDLNKMVDYDLKGNGNTVTLSFGKTEADGAESLKADVTPAKTKPAAAAPAVKKPTVKTAKAKKTPVTTAPKPAAAPAPVTPETAKQTPELTTPTTTTITAKQNEEELPVQEVVAKPIEEDKQEQITSVPAPSVEQPVKSEVVQPAPVPEVVKKPVKTESTKRTSGTKNDGEAAVKLPKMLVSIDFQDADIRDVLRVLAMKSGVNIIHGSDVEGTITIRLDNVPFDRAFQTILSLKGLVSQEQSANILRVATPQKISDERAQAVTFTKIFPLNYARAEEVKANLDSVRQAEGRKGNIAVDSRTNSLIVTDTPEGLVDCEKIISDLDRKPQQVCIEAKIVEMVINNTTDMGIQWQYVRDVAGNPATTVGMSNTAVPAVVNGLAASGHLDAANAAAGGTGVTLGASAVNGALGSFSFGIFKDGEFALSATLSALAQKGLSKLLSSPKVTTINNQQARILVGQKIPYTTTTVSQAGSTQETKFLDVGVKMTVVPTINADKRITLYVKPEVSLFVRADAAGPVIGSREAETTVLVSNGETVVIGGLITDEDRKTGTSVPLLGDLPVIGHLFRRDFKSKDRTELLVFITPKIIEN